MTSKRHEGFVKLTREILLDKLAESEAYKVGSWFKGPSRPDLFIIMHPSSKPVDRHDGKVHLFDWKDNPHVVECKVEVEDIRRGLFQLILAEAAIPRQAGLDFAHGGLRFYLAIPEVLRARDS